MTEPTQTHTPGPLYYDGNRYVRVEETDQTVAEICEDDGHCDPEVREPMPQEANGLLFAAAPDMLHAYRHILERLATSPMQDDEIAALCRLMIAKATE